MFGRKFSDTIRKKKKIIYSILVIFILLLGIGYAVFESNLSFSGTLDVSGYLEPTLYNVLKKEALRGGLAREYTGEHGDSMNSSKSTEKIYHWYAETDDEGTAIQNKNNVIFAGQCWQMIRTTDTGGVKLLYNGEAENNHCLNTRGNHVGYSKSTTQNLNSNYWYGSDYTYDKINQVFSISGTKEQKRWNATTWSDLIGKYTCLGTTETTTCTSLYLIESYYSTSSAYVIPLNSSSHYAQYGKVEINSKSTSVAYVGYMYNTRYNYNSKELMLTEEMLYNSYLSTNYWYGDNATWGTPTANAYNLDNPYQVSSASDYSRLVGKYTFHNNSQTYSPSFVNYIVGVNDNNMSYYIQLRNSENHNIADFNYTYTYGDSYRDNGDGTYTIINKDESNPITINRSDWYAEYNNVGVDKYVCKNAINDTCSDLWYTKKITITSLYYIDVSKTYKYSNSFEYKLDPDDNTYKYFLDDTVASIFFEFSDTNKASMSNAHYTCWNKNGKCTTISYVYFVGGYDENTSFYINIRDGKDVDDALDEMLTANNVNTINSTIKSGVDAWYKHILLDDYDTYIEDTIFCNDRSIRTLNGWNQNGGTVATPYLQFKEYIPTNDLSCTNITDKFSTLNNSAKLAYKVGLMSIPEMNLLNNSNARNGGGYYALITPYYSHFDDAVGWNVGNNGEFDDYYVAGDTGVRPAISLVPGTEYGDGNGSMEKPYYVGEVYNIVNENSLFSIKSKAAPGYDVQISSDDYIVISFKLNGTLIDGDTFTMPSEDVTITDITYVDANYTITNTDNMVTVPSTGRFGNTITLEADGYRITSFKINGTLINGNSFVMPQENVTITEITKVQQVTIESEHNPYANNIDNVVYYEHTFDEATSLTVELTYQTENVSWDWIYLYDDANSSTPFNNKKYGGSTLTTETLTINSNYLKILFKTDISNNNYYGFKAVITPNYN